MKNVSMKTETRSSVFAEADMLIARELTHLIAECSELAKQKKRMRNRRKVFLDLMWVPLLKTLHKKICLGSNFQRESQGNQRRQKLFEIPRVVQVPTGVWQVALQNWKALHKTLDLSFLAARLLLPLFRGLLTNPFLHGLSVVVKNCGLHSSKLLCMILGPFNIFCVLESKLVWVRFVAGGHVLASSLLEASILLALLAATLSRVQVQSLLPLLDFGVLAVLAMLPC